jgi:hypothetical protein
VVVMDDEEVQLLPGHDGRPDGDEAGLHGGRGAEAPVLPFVPRQVAAREADADAGTSTAGFRAAAGRAAIPGDCTCHHDSSAAFGGTWDPLTGYYVSWHPACPTHGIKVTIAPTDERRDPVVSHTIGYRIGYGIVCGTLLAGAAALLLLLWLGVRMLLASQ